MGSRLLALVAAGVLGWAFFDPPRPRPPSERPVLSQPASDAKVEEFQLEVLSPAHEQPPNTAGAVFVHDARQRPYLWGTYIEGDRFQGELRSVPFTFRDDVLYVPVIGYPAAEGNQLTFRVLPHHGAPQVERHYSGPNPGESVAMWRIDTAAWKGREAQLVLRDGASALQGWLGVGQPLDANAREREPTLARRDDRTFNYRTYFLSGAVIAALLWVPGCVLAACLPHRRRWDACLWALPGLLLLAAFGCLGWIAHPLSPGWGRALLGLNVAGALMLLLRPPVTSGSNTLPAWSYAALVLAAAAASAMPLPMPQEYGLGTPVAGRMVASPGDNGIPFVSAAYLARGYDGREHAEAYFGRDWSIGSRGPLAPFAIHTLDQVFQLFPPEPLGADLAAWPAGTEGFFLARWFGMLTNALVVWGAVALTRSLGGVPASSALPWLVLAPVAWINTVFVWPKLLATYFVLLALADVLAQRSPRRIAVWCALAYYAHPVGALVLPAVALLLLRLRLRPIGDARGRDWREALLATGELAAGTLALAAPWLVFKYQLGHPDVFLRYPLGDGRGYAQAESLLSWIQSRAENLWHTLVPGAFHFSQHMHHWTEGSLSEVQRWVIGYAKTLPGNLGYIGFFIALWSGIHNARANASVRQLLTWFALPAFGGMLLFWGYSLDGLGRNCLEPLSAVLVVAAFASNRPWPRWLKLGLLAVAAEAISVPLLSFVSDDAFRIGLVRTDAITLTLLIVSSFMIPLGVAWAMQRETRSGNHPPT